MCARIFVHQIHQLMSDYEKFIASKTHLAHDYGIEPMSLPDTLFDYQKHVCQYLIKKGRAACFLDTGLGKTLIELVVADNYQQKTGKRVLIITPLAVAFQFEREAQKFGMEGVEYSKDGKRLSRIVVCNYERLHLFEPSDYDCVICDESSILKNFKGVTRGIVTSFLKMIKYRFLFTATPSPNDFIELGTSSEALGYMGYTDMLTRFFTNNEDTISPMSIGTKWRLKGHSTTDFFRWASTWSISMRKPSDIGFDDSAFTLPKLIEKIHLVKNPSNMVVNSQILMFNMVAQRLKEVQSEVKATVNQRCEKAAELAAKHEVTVFWVNRNDESDMMRNLDSDAAELRGSMNIDQKEEILLAFLDGQVKKLITKPEITGFGLNWQHCSHTVFFPTFSFEEYYQCLRRFLRYGQKNDVVCDTVVSDGQEKVLKALREKAAKSDALFQDLNKHTNQHFQDRPKTESTKIILPTFVK
jgi:hypothetical protein